VKRHEAKARDIRGQLEALAEFVTPEALAALSEAAENDESWSQAAGDISRYLEERNVKGPPPGSEISLFRAYPGAPPRLNCPGGTLEVCELGPPRTLCLAWVEIKVPGRAHKTRAFKIEICLAEVEVPTYHCNCVPIEDIAVAHAGTG
jgi:hypothetical protein